MYIFIALLFAVFCFILLSYIAFRQVFIHNKDRENLFKGLSGELDGAKRKRRELIEKFSRIPYEEIRIKGFEEKELFCRYYKKSDTAPTAILMHGYKSAGLRDFSGIFDELSSLGFNVLLADQRAHGKSEGKVISFGVKERFDAKKLCEYLADSTDDNAKILLYGVSMGGATVLMASELDLPKKVVGIIADCPFSSPKKIIKKVLRSKGFPSALIYPLVRAGAIIFGGFDPNSASAEDVVSKTEIPILLFHGECDSLVPIEMSEEIIENAKADAQLIKFPEATHTTSVIYDKERYYGALKKFTDKVVR